MGSLETLLDRPEFIHAAINHFPLVGLFVAALGLAISAIAGNRGAMRMGLVLVALLALSVWPVYHFGEGGYDRARSMADEPGAAFLDYHKAIAERWIFVYFVTAGAAGLSLVAAWKWPRSLRAVSAASVGLSAACLVAGVIIAHSGGEVRHREFRTGPPPAVPEAPES
jgi:hypothetical protein